MTTYFYDDAGRVTRTATASSWTDEDRALMLAWRTYKEGLHKPCGHAIATAMHPFSEGWFEQVDEVICWACTAQQEVGDDGTRKPVRFPIVVDTRDHDADPLPPMPMTETIRGGPET